MTHPYHDNQVTQEYFHNATNLNRCYQDGYKDMLEKIVNLIMGDIFATTTSTVNNLLDNRHIQIIKLTMILRWHKPSQYSFLKIYLKNCTLKYTLIILDKISLTLCFEIIQFIFKAKSDLKTHHNHSLEFVNWYESLYSMFITIYYYKINFI